MRKVGSTTDTADANGEYTNGNVANGISPTIINAEMLNTFQRELVNVVEGSGLTLDSGDDGQVFKSIGEIIKNNFPALLEARGYQKFPSGLLIQWGREYSSGTSLNITYPVAFSFPPFFVSSVKITSGDGRFSTVSEPSAEGFTAYGRLANDAVAIDNFFWFAIGV
nr:hypothetical protein [Klebsiella pneumoniae]